MNDAHIQWAIYVLNDKDYQAESNMPDIIQNNPWSVVYRFKTNQGFIFLKCVPSEFSLEPKVINILRSEFQANIPFIITETKEQHCLCSDN